MTCRQARHGKQTRSGRKKRIACIVRNHTGVSGIFASRPPRKELGFLCTPRLQNNHRRLFPCLAFFPSRTRLRDFALRCIQSLHAIPLNRTRSQVLYILTSNRGCVCPNTRVSRLVPGMFYLPVVMDVEINQIVSPHLLLSRSGEQIAKGTQLCSQNQCPLPIPGTLY